MTVAELIEELKKHDPNMMVVVRGYEGGYTDAVATDEIRLHLNVNDAWYYGAHEEDKKGLTPAVRIQPASDR